MMEDFDLHPVRRVFRLDEECYVIYLGRDVEDYKPFLRVGTARDLPAEVRPLVYSVVVTDLLPGSPLLEQQNVPPGFEEFRYIGDPDTVERFKRYLRHTEVPTVGYQEAHEELEEQGAYAYFYDDGNLRLKFDKNEIFNLKRREEADAHYPERARRIKKLFLGSRTRYPSRAFEGAGFFVAHGIPYLYSRGRLAALETDREYFSALAARGIDPDRVSAVVTQEPDEGFVRLLKRVRGTGQLRIESEQPEALRPLTELFAGDGKLALDYEITRLPTDRYVQLLDFRIQSTGSVRLIERTDTPVTIAVPVTGTEGARGGRKGGARGGKTVGGAGGAEAARLTLDPVAGRLSYTGPDGSIEASLIDGAPYRLQDGGAPQADRLVSEYVPGATAGSRSDSLSPAEDAAAGAMSEFFRLAGSGADTQAAVRAVRSAFDALEGSPSPVFWLYLENVRAVARVLAARRPESGGYRRFLQALPKPTDAPGSAQNLPLIGELFVSSREDLQARGSGRGSGGAARGGGDAATPATPVLLYRLAQSVGSDAVAFAEELEERYREELAPPEESVFEDEQERLYDLLAGLDLVKARIPRAQRTEAREREEAQRLEREKTRAQRKATGARTGGEAHESPRVRKRKRAVRRRGAAVIAGLALLLLLGGLGYYLWGPGLPGPESEESAVAEGGDDADRGPDADADRGSESGNGTDPDADTGTGTDTDTAEDEPEAAVEEEETDGDASPAEDGAGEEEEDAARRAAEALAEADIPGLEPRESDSGIVITVIDIIFMANRIAVDNGYRAMGGTEDAGPDPDWIYPGNALALPDGTTHTVIEGDTIWDIAADFIERELASHYEEYDDLIVRYEDGEIGHDDLLDRLASLSDATHAENFESLLQRTIEEVRAE
ncbi:MAG: hypothetical protein ACLFM5_04505 [Spirochaetaceae bacterium]